MIKKTITYTDYNGTERTEDFYFHLSKAEALEMELGTAGGLHAMATRIAATYDTPELIALFKRMILKSYGQKSDDGKRFIKSEELSTAFSQTEAYSILFMELATNADAGAKFFNGIVPKDIEKNGVVLPAIDSLAVKSEG